MNAEALIGTVLGTSQLQQLIGQGGMGAVYLAQQSRPRRQVAVKILMPATALKPHQLTAFLERFRRENDATASLDHPNIMPVYEYGERGGLAYLVMPYISGGTLRDVMERQGQLSYAEALNYTEQMATALDHAHANGIVHRDIKPANMLLTPEGRLLLTDFGLVKLISEQKSDQMRLTGAGAPVGTPDYMSPEQVIGADVDGRADQYSLGVVLFQMLTGTTPFTGETPMQIASQQLHLQPPPPRSFRPDLPEVAERVILKAMSKRPDDRYDSATEFAQAFRSALTQAMAAQKQMTNSFGNSSGGLLSRAGLRNGGTGMYPAAQVNPAAGFMPEASLMSDTNGSLPRAQGTGLLSRTGMFPRIAKDTPGNDPFAGSGSFPTVPYQNNGTGMYPAAGTFATGKVATTGLQSALAPGNTGTIQQLSPLRNGNTNTFNAYNPEQTGSTTSIKLTGAVKVVQVPVANGQYVTGLLPVQQASPISEPGMRKNSRPQKILLIIAVLILLIGGIGSTALYMRTHSPATSRSGISGSKPNPTATFQANATSTAINSVLFSDTLANNIHNFTVDNLHYFTGGAYHVVNQSANGAAVIVQEPFSQNNLKYQVTMEEIKGDDGNTSNTFGIIFRFSTSNANGKDIEKFYSFEVLNENGGNAGYAFYKYDNSSQNTPWNKIWPAAAADTVQKAGNEFHQGQGDNAKNTISVIANGNNFTFYVNGTKVGDSSDGSLGADNGKMGLLVSHQNTEVAFSNLSVVLP